MERILSLYRSKKGPVEIAKEVADYLKEMLSCQYVCIFEVNLKIEHIVELYSSTKIFNDYSYLGQDCFLFKLATNSDKKIFNSNDEYHITNFKSITYKSKTDLINGTAVPVLGINNNVVALIITFNKFEGDNFENFNKNNIQLIDNAASILGVTIEALEAHSKAVSFLDSITHEILAPMAGVKNTSKFLIDYFDRQTNDSLSDKIKRTKKNLNEIYRSSQMSISLVQSITMFSRSVQMTRKDLKLIPCDLYDKVFKKCKQNISPLALSRKFDPNRIVAIEYNHWPKVIIDRIAFIQVLTNLFNNAVKYAFDDPESFVLQVELKTNQDGSADLYVKDYGIGIQEKLKEKIFYPGVRDEAAIKKVPTGTGIGLSTVKRLLDLHGITIFLDSTSLPTKFVLRFPKELLAR